MNWLINLFVNRTFGAIRSSEWPTFRKQHLKEVCEFCQSPFFRELHHVQPFHLHPELELDPENLITLCRRHHFELGHFFDWSNFNKDISQWIIAKNQ